jgi:hypothetical protein
MNSLIAACAAAGKTNSANAKHETAAVTKPPSRRMPRLSLNQMVSRPGGENVYRKGRKGPTGRSRSPGSRSQAKASFHGDATPARYQSQAGRFTKMTVRP